MDKKNISANEMTPEDWEGRHENKRGRAGIYAGEMKSLSWRDIYIPKFITAFSQ